MLTRPEPRSGIEHIKENFLDKYHLYNFLRFRFETLLETMEDQKLADFTRYVIDSTPKYWLCPGSTDKGKHHCYIGGLAFHSITAAALGSSIVQHYKLAIGMKDINSSLVVAGIILHDIGKTECYKPVEGDFNSYSLLDEPAFMKTPEDRKFHHIPIGYKLICDKARDCPGLNQQTIDDLAHIILSHHGHRAWSSPVIPDSPEAYIVHAVEMMDGLVEKFYIGQNVKDIYGH